MPATVTVTPYYNKTTGILSNYLNWTFTPSLPEEAEIVIFRSIGIQPDIDATDFNLSEIKRLKKSATSYVDEKIVEGLTYYYSVRGTNEDLEEFPTTTSSINYQIKPELIALTPINFKIKSYTRNNIVFSWEFESLNQAPIFIEYSEGNDYNFRSLISNLASNTKEFTLSNFNIKNNTYFRCYTKLEDSVDENYSNIITFNTFFSNGSIPQAPTNLSFAPLTETTGKLTWTNVNENVPNLEHLIWISSPSGSAILYDAVLSVDDITSSSVILEDLDPATQYCFTCQARGEGGKSVFADAVTGITVSEDQAPTPVINLSVTNICEPAIQSLGNFLVENSKVQRITWTNPALELASTKQLNYATDNSFTNASSLFLNLTATSIDIPFLTPNTTYHYIIISENLVSSVSSASTSLLLPNPPALPTSLSLNALGTTTLLAEWGDSTNVGDPNQEQFFILQLSGPFTQYINDSRILPADTTSYIFNGLIPNTTYNARVYSLGYGGVSGDASNWTSATQSTISNTNAPNAPTDLYFSGQVDPTTIQFCFTDNADDEDGFEIGYGAVGSNIIRQRYIPPTADPAPVTSCGTIINLIPNTTYNMAVRAFKGEPGLNNQVIYSNLANVSGGSEVLLSFTLDPFTFNNQSSAITITNLGSSLELTDDEFIVVVSGEFDDPYPSYGQGFEVYRIVNNIEIKIKDQTSNEPRLFEDRLFSTNEGDQISYVAKKYVNTFGPKYYSSGTINSITLGSIPQPPKFIGGDNPQVPTIDLFATVIDNNTYIQWKAYSGASSLTLYQNSTSLSDVVYSENPATGLSRKYIVPERFTVPRKYILVLENEFFTTSRELLAIPSTIPTGSVDPNEEPQTEESYGGQFAVKNIQYTNPSRNLARVTWEYETIPLELGQTTKIFYVVTFSNSLVTSGEITNLNITSIDLLLTQGNDYLITFVGQNQSFEFSKFSFLSVFLTEPQIPPPSNFRFTATTKQRVAVAWSAVSFATSYVIKKVSIINNSTVEEFFEVNSTQLFFEDTNLVLNSTVTYSIQSVSPSFRSEFSTLLTYNVPDDPTPPTAGTVVDAPRACIIQGVNPGNVYYQVRRN